MTLRKADRCVRSSSHRVTARSSWNSIRQSPAPARPNILDQKAPSFSHSPSCNCPAWRWCRRQKLVTSTDELDFNDQLINTPSAPMTLQVSNGGALELDVAAPTITPSTDFILTPASDCTLFPLPSPLSGFTTQTTCTVSVVFSPTAPGVRTATLMIPSDDPDGLKAGKAARRDGPPGSHYGSTVIQFWQRPRRRSDFGGDQDSLCHEHWDGGLL